MLDDTLSPAGDDPCPVTRAMRPLQDRWTQIAQVLGDRRHVYPGAPAVWKT